jgi:response regulator RpfG family c-di-GMP phosphodiesterase
MRRASRIQQVGVSPALGRITLVLTLVPVALGATAAYEQLGAVGALAFGLPAVLLALSARRYLAATRVSVARVEHENQELLDANADLRDLVDFTAGLSAHARDSETLTAYLETSLAHVTGGRVKVTVGSENVVGNPLEASGRVVGGLSVEGGDAARWERLRDSVERQVALTLESALLAEEARASHLETIEALSRSMDAKDYFAGGHTERVSDIAVGLAKRLGYSGADLDAIEIGALMHDVGKIGIPESILHKPSPLDNDEWIVMKRHPVISELILSETNLSPFVLQIARSSHERMDGLGYPDGLSGHEIPMPARIVLVADAFEALTTDRPYRRARRPRAALEEIVANKDTQFCPQVVAALQRLYDEEPAVLGEVGLTVVASA